MRVRRRLSGLAFCCALATAAAGRAQTPPVRVGLADVARGEAAHAAVAALRARLETRPGIALPRDAARAALEEPLPADGEADVAARPRAMQLVRAARDAYSRFDYDGALERLRQAELALATAPPVPDVTRLLVEINLLAGVVHADRGDTARALEDFLVAQRLEPERKALDPGRYRPRVVALYAQAAASSPGARGARLEVVTDPAGAEVWIDGRRAGPAPLTATLEAGAHYVAAVAGGSAPRLERPLLRAGEDSRLALLLSRSAPEERARQARAELLAGRLDWEQGPAALAASASLDLVVLVRDAAPSEGAEAAIYDARAGTRGPWMPATPPEPVLVALASALAAPSPAPASLVTREGHERDAAPAAATPWYRSWWLAPPLIAVGAAAAFGTLWIIDRERTTTYAINHWCFNNTCSP